jgi:hypothetical protein
LLHLFIVRNRVLRFLRRREEQQLKMSVAVNGSRNEHGKEKNRNIQSNLVGSPNSHLIRQAQRTLNYGAWVNQSACKNELGVNIRNELALKILLSTK